MSSENNSGRLPLPEDGQTIEGKLPTAPVEGVPTPLDDLTDNQRNYLEGRLNGMTPFAAGRYAGLSEASLRASTYQMERHPKVRAAAKFVLEKGIGGEVDRTTVLTGLMDAVQSASTSAELTMAWREIGKLVGAYAPDRTEHVIRDLTHDRLRTVSDQELLGMVPKGESAPTEVVEAMDGEFEVLKNACEEPEVINPDVGEG